VQSSRQINALAQQIGVADDHVAIRQQLPCAPPGSTDAASEASDPYSASAWTTPNLKTLLILSPSHSRPTVVVIAWLHVRRQNPVQACAAGRLILYSRLLDS
jgi:hypothetical protein